MSADFILDSKGYCFLCLKEISKADLERTEKPLLRSLQQLSFYLRMDLVKVFTDWESIPLYLLAKLKHSKLKAPLCEKCAGLNDKLSDVVQQLDKIQMEAVSCINSINEQLEMSVKTGETKQFRKLLDRHSLDVVAAGKLKIVELLRLEVMKKSARCLYNAQPRVEVEKLEEGANEGPFVPEEFFTTDETSFDSELSEDLEESYLDTPEDDSNMEEDDIQYLDVNEASIGDINEDGLQPSSKTSSPDSDRRKVKIQLRNFDEIPDIVNAEDSTSPSKAELRKMSANLPLKIIHSEEESGDPKFSVDPETGKHTCGVCSKEFKNNPSFYSHYKSTHLKVRYECTLCGKQFRRRDNFGLHHRNFHMGIRFKCNLCDVVFTRRTLLRKHKMAVHAEGKNLPPLVEEDEAEITVMGDRYVDGPTTGTILLSDDEMPELELESEEVEEEYEEEVGSENEQLPSTSSNLDAQPLSVFNPVTGKHKCRLCKREFRYRSSCKLHHQSVHMGVRVKCYTCNKTFSQRSHLRYHQRTSCGLVRQREPVYTCQLCGKGYATEKTLQQHLRIRHKEVQNENGTPVETENDSLEYVEEALEMEMDEDEEAFIDVQSEEGELSESDPLSIDPDNDDPSNSAHSSNSIPKVNAEDGGADVSLETTSQPESTIKTVDSLSEIRNSYNFRTGKYKCGLCAMEFTTMAGVRYHARSIHLNVKYKCNQCEKEFACIGSYNKHYRSVHLGVRHECEVCKKTFSQKGHLTYHRRTSCTGGRNPGCRCGICGKVYVEIKVLRRHLKTVHLKLREHECETCGKKFHLNCQLNVHKRKVHRM